MNIFFLDKMPKLAAEFTADAHVRKSILECVEMLGYAYPKKIKKPWKWKGDRSHHQMSRWVRYSRQNFDWTLQYAYALCEEFEHRFGKTHACVEHLDWISHNLPMDSLPDIGKTDPPRCFEDHDIDLSEDAVYDYRRYYKIAKDHLAKWTKREVPFWY